METNNQILLQKNEDLYQTTSTLTVDWRRAKLQYETVKKREEASKIQHQLELSKKDEKIDALLEQNQQSKKSLINICEKKQRHRLLQVLLL